jgi:hypothetical protein
MSGHGALRGNCGRGGCDVPAQISTSLGKAADFCESAVPSFTECSRLSPPLPPERFMALIEPRYGRIMRALTTTM